MKPLSVERLSLLPFSSVGRRIFDRLRLDRARDGTPRASASRVADVRMAKHLTATWSIPDEYGGMTSALLHRSRALLHEAGISTDVLTFDWRPSYSAVREKLRERGVTVEGVDIVNMWEWLADLEEENIQTIRPNFEAFDDFAPLCRSLEPSAGGMSRQRRYSCDGKTLLQQDYFRQDGSLFVSDRLGSGADDAPSGRRIFLCDLAGEPFRVLSSTLELQHFWIDLLTTAQETFLIIDSKYVANFMAEYRRPHVTTLYMVHGSHLDWRASSPFAPLTPPRREAFRALEKFDAVVLLTDDQRRDTAARLGDFGNMYVIPNSRHIEPERAEGADRDEMRSVMVASLQRRKQVDHAIRSIGAANARMHDKISLHIFGKGPEHRTLLDLISDAGLESHIHLEGFTKNVADEFAKASFSLLTSRAEGFGLVIVEAMSHGCIPISYDMKYGPAQIINDGVDGFLVPVGDEDALAAAVQRWIELEPHKKAAMRKAAMERSRAFTDEAIVPLWISTFAQAQRWKEDRIGRHKVAASDGRVMLKGEQPLVSCTVNFETPPVGRGVPEFPMLLALRERSGRDVHRRNASTVTKLTPQSFRITSQWPADVLTRGTADTVYDAYVEVGGSDGLRSVRIPAGDLDHRTNAYSTVKGNLSFRL